MERSLFPREHWQVMISKAFNHFNKTYTHLSITLFSDVNNIAIWEWQRILFFSWNHNFSINTGEMGKKSTFEELFSSKVNIGNRIFNSEILFSWYLSTELSPSPHKLQWCYKSLKHTTDKTWQAGITWISKTKVTVQNW